MKPQDVLAKLKSNASAKTCRTLDAIFQVCQEQEERGVYEFTPRVIAKLGYKRGVPREQSIRNKSGEHYRALLRAFESFHSSKTRQLRKTGDHDWVDEIPNPTHRLLVRAQEAELKAAKKLLQEIVPPGERINVFDYQNVSADGDTKLSDVERRALDYIISEKFLKTWDFSKTEFGEIVDSNGAVVLRAATVSAVEKALSSL